MKVLMISTDRGILEDGSAVRKRMVEYGTLVEELHIVVFVKGNSVSKKEGREVQIASNIFAYSTNSLSRWLYVFDAYRIASRVIFKIRNVTSSTLLVTCQDPFEVGLVGALLKWRHRIPLEIQIHTDLMSPYFGAQSFFNRLRIRIARTVLPHADGVRAVSHRIKRSLSNVHVQISKVTVLPVLVDPERFRKAPLKATAALRDRFLKWRYIILTVARLSSEKNVALAIRAFARVAKREPQAGLLVLGDGPERKRLEVLARALGVYDQVAFEGFVHDVPLYYASADAFLFTSNYEGYGLALVEAALSGRAIVTTEVGVSGSLIRNNESGLVCPVGDEQCLAEKLDRLLADHALRARLGERAREQARSMVLSKEAFLSHMKKFWEEAPGSNV